MGSLELYLGEKISPKMTLLFFDEIQAASRAITSLKYFCEEAPEYDVVAAGSLLGVSVGKNIQLSCRESQLYDTEQFDESVPSILHWIYEEIRGIVDRRH